jgi:ectoine hydroxylase-related dioxygenase (phytanoyl-CoA dioxygenase family)
MKPGRFIIFDSNILHAAKDITTDRKRFAIDYAVRRNTYV